MGNFVRVRWAAIGAALALLAGGGTLAVVRAASSGGRSVFVPITPCRLLDTRKAPDNVGPRNTPIGAGESLTVQVRGTNGNCTIPTDATAIVMNTTAVGPTAASFVTLFPDDVERPLAANLNTVPGGAPTPNLVTVALSATGAIKIFNLAGNVDVIGDITGFYAPEATSGGPAGSTGPAGPAGTNGAPGAQGPVGIGSANLGQIVNSVDPGLGSGRYASMAIGIDGLPIISEQDSVATHLKIVHCTNTACGTKDAPSTIDAANSTGQFSSIAIGIDGVPIIAYYADAAKDLKVVHCTRVDCSSSEAPVTVDATGADVGSFAAITVGSDGLPIIAYADLASGNLKILHCTTVNCSQHDAPRIVTLLSTATYSIGIVIGADGFPFIVHSGVISTDAVTAVHCTNVSCSAGVQTVGQGIGATASVTIGRSGFPVIALFDGGSAQLKMKACSEALCSTGAYIQVDPAAGASSSIAIGTDGLPLIASLDDSGSPKLHVDHCHDLNCTAVDLRTFEAVTDVAGLQNTPSLRIGVDGMPIVAYRGGASSTLRVLHCSNVRCVPFVRP
jgi:hypothetical protein